MRILVVQESDWLRRNPHQHHQMLERLSAQGHAVLVLDYPIRWREEEEGRWVVPRRVYRDVAKVVPEARVTVIRTAMPRVAGLGKLAWLASNTVEIRRALATFQPDVVVVLGLSNGYAALRLARAAGVPVVVHLIDALHTLAEPPALRPAARWVERALLQQAAAVVPINHALADYAVQLGAAPARVTRIPTGCDLARFGPQVDGTPVRTAYGIRPDETVLLYLGWLYPFSGVDEVATRLAGAAGAGLRLLVVGDGDLLPHLQRLRNKCLGERLILVGKQPAAQIPAFVAAADCCLLPAQANATMAHIVPAKLYDYLAGGKPVLATPLPGLVREFGQDAGIRYASGPAALLAEARSLAADPAAQLALGVQARRTAEATGSWETVTARFWDVLATVGTSKLGSCSAGLARSGR